MSGEPGYPIPGLPEGHEALRVDLPKVGDLMLVISRNGSPVAQVCDASECFPRLILRKIPPILVVPPGCFQPGTWITCDKDGDTWAHPRRPIVDEDRWIPNLDDDTDGIFLGTTSMLPWLRWPPELHWTQRIVEVKK